MNFFDIFSFFIKKQKFMKKIIFLGLALVSLTACSSVQHKDPTPPKIGSPNPASQYCVEQGGKLEIRNEANGQVGYCHLPNGQVVEEWKLRGKTMCAAWLASKAKSGFCFLPRGGEA